MTKKAYNNKDISAIVITRDATFTSLKLQEKRKFNITSMQCRQKGLIDARRNWSCLAIVLCTHCRPNILWFNIYRVKLEVTLPNIVVAVIILTQGWIIWNGSRKET